VTSNFSNNSHPLIAASELREDPITGRTTVIAAGRADRPAAFTAPDRTAAPGSSGGLGRAGRVCPFCEGNEGMTPPEVWADRDPGTAPDTPGWHVRVIPNKYPAFTPGRAGTGAGGNGIPGGVARPAEGVHEVVVQGPDHRLSLTELPEATLVEVVAAWRRRLAELRRVWPGAVTLITNQGRDAGASLEHSHSQVCATSFRPALIATEAERLAGPACAACAMVGRERELGVRMVGEHEGLVALCPWASVTPMEALLLPAGHDARFEAGGGDPTESAESARDFAHALTGLLRRLTGAVGFEPAVNLVVHTAPPGVEDFHWHLHAYPRLTIPAGYELGTGTMINVVDPDHAAARLRAAALPAGSR
jgi:UDPglucose--hexose-1-phosphate uridylyltransferase